jgi:hypothetical protein
VLQKGAKIAPLQLRNADWYHILVKTAAFWHPKRPVGWKWKAAIRKLTEPRAELQECVTCLCNFEACSLRLAIKIRCHMWRGHVDWLKYESWHVGKHLSFAPNTVSEPEQYLRHPACTACTACAHQALRFVMVMFMVAFKFDLAAAWSWWTE